MEKVNALKILVLSDSHRIMSYMERAVRTEQPDYIFHLGDYVSDAQALSRIFPTVPMVYVRGNCDYDAETPELQIDLWGGVRFLLTHGHRYHVKQDLLYLSIAAKEAQVDVALFGHTHNAFCELYDGIWLLNPGSCGNWHPSYGVVEIENQTPACRIVTFD